MKSADFIDMIVKARVSEYGIYVDLINELDEVVASLDGFDFSDEFIAGAKGITAYVKRYALKHNRGLTFVNDKQIKTQRLRYGANGDIRVNDEHIYVFQKETN